MNILIITQYFWPENFRVNELALEFQRKGHVVTVLTGIPNYPGGLFFDGYGVFKKRKEDYGGVAVIRVPLIPRGKSRGIRLVLNYLSFALSAALLGPFYCRGPYDTIFVFEPSPITVGVPAIVLKWIKKAPILFWVLDLWPESLSAAGGVTSVLILDSVGRLARFIYSQCDRILVSSKGFMRQISAMGIPPDKISYFPNWTEDAYWHLAAGCGLKSGHSFPDGFKIMFAGNIGVAQGFPTILAAAERLKDSPDIHWLIVGDGRMFEWAIEQIESRGLQNVVHMLGRHPPETVVGLLMEADALLVTLKREPVFSLTIPGKMQSYLACGKPIIASLDGEGAKLIEESGGGISCPAEDVDALAAAVRTLRNMPTDARKKMGAKGRRFCESNFSRSTLLGRLEDWMTQVSKEYTGPV